MAQYEPIRDAFREFNRLLIDSQQWDERHAANKADREFKHSMLVSNIQQQQFDRAMAEKRYELSVRGEDRLAQSLKLQAEAQALNHDLRKAEAGRDKRRLAIAEEKNNREKEIHVQNMEVAQKLTTPVDLDLKGMIPDHLAQNPAFMTELNELTNESMGGAHVDTDLVIKRMHAGEGARAVQMKPIDQRDLVPALTGLMAKYNDPNLNAKINIENLTDARRSLQKQVKQDSKMPFEKAMMNREIKKLDAEINNQYSTFRAINSRDNLFQRASDLKGSAAWLRQRGMDKQADKWDQEALKLGEMAYAADKQSKGQMIQLYNRKLDKEGKAVGAGKATFDTVDNMYQYTDDDGEIIKSTELPEGITAVKPTETFGKGSGAKTAQDDITVAQMKDFRNEFKTDGAQAMFASNAGKPVDQTLQHLATAFKVRKGLNNLASRQSALAFYREQETEYWGSMDQIPLITDPKRIQSTMQNKVIPFMKAVLEQEIAQGASEQRIAFLKRSLNRAVKARTRDQGHASMEEFTLMVFKEKYRKQAQDPTMIVYDPTNKTRAMLEGIN